MINGIRDSLRNDPPIGWYHTIKRADYPHDYFSIFGALTANIFSLIFPPFMTVILITGVADFVLLPDKQKERDWLAKDYLLKIVKVTENIQIPFFRFYFHSFQTVGCINETRIRIPLPRVVRENPWL